MKIIVEMENFSKEEMKANHNMRMKKIIGLFDKAANGNLNCSEIDREGGGQGK